MTNFSRISLDPDLHVSQPVYLAPDAEPRWPRTVRLMVFLTAASASWALVIGMAYYAFDLADRLF